MVVVFREPLYTKYSNSILSFAFLFRLVVVIAIVVVPFVISYATHAFWVKEGIYREQAKVSFKHQIIVLAEGATPNLKLFWSTNPILNSLMPPDQIRIPSIKSREIDYNADSLVDEISIDVTLSLQQGETIHRALLLTVYDYELSERVELDMEGICVADHSSPLPGSSVYIIGELRLKQQGPLRTSPRIALDPILSSNITSVGDVLLPDILLDVMRRNVTTECPTVTSPLWMAGVGPSFTIHLTLRIPPLETIHYRPPAYEAIKFAWVQYVAALTFVWAILYLLQLLVFKLHLLPTFITHDNAPPQPFFKKLS